MLRSTLPSALLFIIGYALVAGGMIAVRNLIGYVGNGTDIVSLVLASLMVAFVLGINAGTRITAGSLSIRQRVIRNLMAALFLFGFSLSVVIDDAFFLGLIDIGIINRLILTVAFAFIFLLPSAFLLGQSVPLLSAYFRNLAPSQSTGRTLLSLGVGGICGALVTLLILMPFSGVHIAALAVMIFLALGIALLNRALTWRTMWKPCLLLLFLIALNSQVIFQGLGIYYQNVYNSVRIVTSEDGTKALFRNNQAVSQYNPETGSTGIANEKVEQMLLPPNAEGAQDILVIGAGGFTFGLKDTKNSYTYVDFDPDIKGVSEDHFLGQKLGPNKTFVAGSARDALLDAMRSGRKYDIVYFNAYNGEVWLPESLVTRDFFDDIRQVLKPEGIAAATLVVSPKLANDYSLYLDNTFRSVFPVQMRMPLYNASVAQLSNMQMLGFLYIGYNAPLAKSGTIYTDDRNPAFWHKPAKRYY